MEEIGHSLKYKWLECLPFTLMVTESRDWKNIMGMTSFFQEILILLKPFSLKILFSLNPIINKLKILPSE